MEARDVPTHWWSPGGADLSAATPGNWLMGPGVPYAPWTIAPDSRHHTIFDGAVSNLPCVVPAGMAPPMPPAPPTGEPHLPRKTFTGMHLVNGYQGTVTLNPAHMGVDQFQITSGAIAQPATTLTVGLLTWTGGTINNSTTPGFLNLAGTGIAEPTNAGTVNLGSTFTLLGNETTLAGATLDVLKGTFKLLRGDGFVVEAHSKISLKAKPGATGTITVDGVDKPNPSPYISVSRGGLAEINSVDRAENDTTHAVVTLDGGNDDQNAYFHNAGTTVIKGRTELVLKSKADKFGYYAQDRLVDLGGAAPLTSLEAGSKITCTGEGKGWVTIEKGTLEVRNLLQDGEPIAEQPLAVIAVANTNNAWDLQLKDGTILTMPDAKHNTLFVDGTFRSEGEIQLAISPTTTNCDKVRATKAVDVDGATSKLSLRWPESTTTPGNGHTWELLESVSDEVTVLPPAANITVPDPKITVERKGNKKFIDAVYKV